MDEAAHGYERLSLANMNDQNRRWKAPTGQVMIVAIIVVLFVSMVLHLL
jgi:hypothetical protein